MFRGHLGNADVPTASGHAHILDDSVLDHVA